MKKNLALLLAGALAGGLMMSVAPAGADNQPQETGGNSARTGNRDAASVGEAGDNPPRPFMRSHGVRIRAARIGFCTAEQVEDEHGCAFPDVFITTRPLPVHPRGHVRVDTRVDASEVSVSLFCGSAAPVWQLGPRRWVFHVNHKQGTRKRCDGGSITITYDEGTEFAGGKARHTFSTKPHRH